MRPKITTDGCWLARRLGVGADVEIRLEKMVPKGLDVVIIDTAHGHTAGVIWHDQTHKARLA